MPPIPSPRVTFLSRLAWVLVAALVWTQATDLGARPSTQSQSETQAKSQEETQSQGEDEQKVFRIQVNTVPLSVQVVDGKGRPVTGLTRQDFEIYEDGVLQQALHFLPPDEGLQQEIEPSQDRLPHGASREDFRVPGRLAPKRTGDRIFLFRKEEEAGPYVVLLRQDRPRSQASGLPRHHQPRPRLPEKARHPRFAARPGSAHRGLQSAKRPVGQQQHGQDRMKSAIAGTTNRGRSTPS